MTANTAPESALRPPERPDAAWPARPRRILFLEPNHDGTVGGSHQVLYDFARHMDRARYEPVAVFYQDNSYVPRLRDLGVRVHVLEAQWQAERRATRSGLPRRAVAMLQAIARRQRFIHEEAIVLLHVNGTPQTGQDDWLPAARLAGIPAIANCAGHLRFDVRSRVQRRLMRSFDQVLPVTDCIARETLEFGYAPDRVTRIYPGIDIDEFRARVRRDPATVRAAIDLPPEDLLVTMVGNIRRWKGQHVVIDAFARLEPTLRSQLKLLFLGATAPADLSYERELRQAVIANGLESTVAFMGRREDVAEIVAASDIVIHASTEAEPFGLVVVEAMALGRAVIASALGGPVETLDATSGLTFDPTRPEELAERIALLAASPERRRALGEAARVRAERFTIGATVAATTVIYDRLLGRPASTGERLRR